MALLVLTLTLALSVSEPLVLVAVPFLVLLLARPVPRSPAILAGVLAALVAFGGSARTGLWYLERGWAVVLGGWFVALTLRFPTSRFTSRALGALAGTFAVATLFFLVRGGEWPVVDWLVQERIGGDLAVVLEALRVLREGALPPELVELAYRTAEMQRMVFPALLGLASMSALALAWWLYVRIAERRDDGVGPLSGFRFNDQLVWIMIGGLILVILGWGGMWARTGSNAVVFMGGLYALRGIAVLVFLAGGLSVGGAVLLFLGLLLPVVGSVILGGALVIGVGDTWLDLRRRAIEAGRSDGR